ncbi:MAG: STAS domain-containing protein [Tepidisphaeraceae bacterium]
MPALDVQAAQTDDAVIVALKSDAGAANADALDAAVLRLSAMRPRLVVLDLSQTTLIASLCIGSLVALRRGIVAHGGTVRIAGASPLIDLTLRRAKLDLIFPMHATVAESLAHDVGEGVR